MGLKMKQHLAAHTQAPAPTHRKRGKIEKAESHPLGPTTRQQTTSAGRRKSPSRRSMSLASKNEGYALLGGGAGGAPRSAECATWSLSDHFPTASAAGISEKVNPSAAG